MKVVQAKTHEIQGDDFLTIESSVNKSKLSKLYAMLSNIYRNPIGAIVREYVSNAYDANKEANFFKELSYEDCCKKYPWMVDPLFQELNLSREKFNTLKKHITKSGEDAPVIVGIDNENPSQTYFYVRDFGIGMSVERMQHIFFNYLSTTKEDNNDEIGGLTCRFI